MKTISLRAAFAFIVGYTALILGSVWLYRWANRRGQAQAEARIIPAPSASVSTSHVEASMASAEAAADGLVELAKDVHEDTRDLGKEVEKTNQIADSLGASVMKLKVRSSECEEFLEQLFTARCEQKLIDRVLYFKAEKPFPPRHMHGVGRFQCPPDTVAFVDPYDGPMGDWAYTCVPEVRP